MHNLILICTFVELSYSKKAKKLKKDRDIDRFYSELAKAIRKRKNEMMVARNLEELLKGPGRHEHLTQNKKSQYSCRISPNHRLIYESCFNKPTDAPSEVVAVKIIDIKDYH